MLQEVGAGCGRPVGLVDRRDGWEAHLQGGLTCRQAGYAGCFAAPATASQAKEKVLYKKKDNVPEGLYM